MKGAAELPANAALAVPCIFLTSTRGHSKKMYFDIAPWDRETRAWPRSLQVKSVFETENQAVGSARAPRWAESLLPAKRLPGSRHCRTSIDCKAASDFAGKPTCEHPSRLPKTPLEGFVFGREAISVHTSIHQSDLLQHDVRRCHGCNACRHQKNASSQACVVISRRHLHDISCNDWKSTQTCPKETQTHRFECLG